MGEWVVKSANAKHVKVKIYNNTTKNIFYYPKINVLLHHQPSYYICL